MDHFVRFETLCLPTALERSRRVYGVLLLCPLCAVFLHFCCMDICGSEDHLNGRQARAVMQVGALDRKLSLTVFVGLRGSCHLPFFRGFPSKPGVFLLFFPHRWSRNPGYVRVIGNFVILSSANLFHVFLCIEWVPAPPPAQEGMLSYENLKVERECRVVSAHRGY